MASPVHRDTHSTTPEVRGEPENGRSDFAPRPSAAVVLLRDTATGVEVLLVRRHARSQVLGGAWVFPGGKTDPCDADPGTLAAQRAPFETLQAALGEPELERAAAAGLFMAAVRETFEEAGIILADGAGAKDVERARSMASAGVPFAEILACLSLQIGWTSLVPWARWITPRMPALFSRRFDARFFLAAAPPDQVALHDDHEATESRWWKPRALLAHYRDGAAFLAPAQIMSLVTLARYRCVADAMAAARHALPPPLIEPEPFTHGPLRAVAFPGHAQHPVAAIALPGPSFLVYRNERFEPVDGFAALFN